ncbi:hypothetical protein GJV26_28975 [Massilia dura]|uniref:Sel1 repeat family protein n=1 Tax=Pseudoduganella dura TaxID=321982 RepID=A0A6I3XRN3_9BURK|nr:SEL1-like repeat protein [Pseudoduganella dura]MUI16461.1 hypothetical protein [Pseudoduganella dura]GGX86965.1 hypothetical protein GCM10007386_17290 [Pseudoduganella dura]
MKRHAFALAGILFAAAPSFATDLAADLAAARLALHGPASGWPPALAAFSAAAREGDADAAYRAGLMVRNGKGTAPDSAAARRWLEQAASGGIPEAMFVLANLQAEGEGGAVDLVAARAWLERAAGLGHPAALQQLAELARRRGDGEQANALLKEAAHALKHQAGP